MKQFKDLLEQIEDKNSYKKRIDFMRYESGLERIGTGSGRDVYALDDKHVIKIGKNIKGIHQNGRESDYLFNDMYQEYIAKTLYSDPENYSYIIAQRGKNGPKSKQQLDKVLQGNYGITLKELENVTDIMSTSMLIRTNDSYEKLAKIMKDYQDSGLIVELHDMSMKFETIHGDLTRHSSWGFVDDRLCLLDYGLNKEDYLVYYRKTASQHLKNEYPKY